MIRQWKIDEQRWLEAELAAHRDFLRRLIQARGFTLSKLDECFGYRRSYLSRVLKGQTSLTVVHVLAILEAIDYPPTAYFSALYPPPERETTSEELRRLVARIETLLPGVEPTGLAEAETGEPRKTRIDKAVDEAQTPRKRRRSRG